MRHFAHAALIAALLAAWPEAAGDTHRPANVLHPYFAKVADKGFPVGGWAFRDGTGAVDVAASGVVTRYDFDEEGAMTSRPAPRDYNRVVLRLARFSAADAARAAAERVDEGEEVRAVTMVTEGTGGMFLAAVYKNHKYVGKHRFLMDDGRWDGYEDAIGERDPLGSRENEEGR